MMIREGMKNECPFVSRDGLADCVIGPVVFWPELLIQVACNAISEVLPTQVELSKHYRDNDGRIVRSLVTLGCGDEATVSNCRSGDYLYCLVSVHGGIE